MSGVGQLQEALEAAEKSRAYITRLDWLDIGESFLKARLYLDSDLFVQVYRNDKYSTTNFALIQGEFASMAVTSFPANGIAIPLTIRRDMTRAPKEIARSA